MEPMEGGSGGGTIEPARRAPAHRSPSVSPGSQALAEDDSLSAATHQPVPGRWGAALPRGTASGDGSRAPLLPAARVAWRALLVLLVCACAVPHAASSGSVTHLIATRPGAPPLSYVDWCHEPLHKAQFENEHVRVYKAEIPGGKQTLFHRHRENTCYVTLDNGNDAELVNEKLTDQGTDEASFVEEVGAMAEGDPFFMMHKDEHLIHRIKSKEDNAGAVKFLGVEMLRSPALSTKWQLRHLSYDLLIQNDAARVYRLLLRPSEVTDRHTFNFCGIVVFVSGGDLSVVCDGEETKKDAVKEGVMGDGPAWEAFMERMPDGITASEQNRMRQACGIERSERLEQLQVEGLEAAERGDEDAIQRIRRELWDVYDTVVPSSGTSTRMPHSEEKAAPRKSSKSPFGRGTPKGGWEWFEGPVTHDIRNKGQEDFDAILIELR